MSTHLGFLIATAIAAPDTVIGSIGASIKEAVLSPEGRHTAIVLALLAFAAICSWSIRRESEKLAQEWLNPLLAAEENSALAIAEGVLNSNQAARLQRQFDDVRGRAAHHMDVMVVFYRNYYSAIILASISGVVSAIALLFITTGGWNSSNQYVKTIFLTATAGAALFKAYPSIFKQQDNIKNNKTLYLKYVALQNEISSYTATGVAFLAKPDATADDFIHHVDERMESLNDISIGLDSSKIPVLDDVIAKARAVRSDTTIAVEQEEGHAPAEGVPEKPAVAGGKDVRPKGGNGSGGDAPAAIGARTEETVTAGKTETKRPLS